MKKQRLSAYWFMLLFLIFILFIATILTYTDQEKEVEWAKNILTSEWFMQSTERNWSRLFWQNIIGYLPSNPYALLSNKLPYLLVDEWVVVEQREEQEDYQAAALLSNQWYFSQEKLREMTLPEEVQVILYHTHNAETYLPTAGVSKVTGKNGGVVLVGEKLKSRLENNYGIRTLHNQTIHDYPDWSRSYHNSLNTINSLLKGNTDVQAVFDIHRDAGYTKKEATTVMINGKAAAKIMIVIGANHEHWQENFAFAQRLEECADKYYPGLLKDLRVVQTSRYNQQAHPHSLILEIGSDLNTQEEADYAIECFARVIAEVL